MHDDGVLAVDGIPSAVLPSPVLASPPLVLDGLAQAPGWSGKRAADLILSAVLLVVTLPLFLAIALVVKATSPGPVFFRQRRVGRGGEEFPMLKFRTMRADSEALLRSDPALHDLFVKGGHKIPCRLDPRVTTIGRVLRRLSLDELPQLLNVLLGHMSMVGPRPVERSQLVRDYAGYESAYMALRPGLTGLWQVSGRSTVHFPERAELDSHYVRACSASMDARIILRTPLVVVTGQGAE